MTTPATPTSGFGGGVTLIPAGQDTGTYLPGAAFVPGAAAEDIGTAERVAADAECYLPAGTAVSIGDRVTYQGITYMVAGQPQSWTSPFTGLSSPIRVQLRR